MEKEKTWCVYMHTNKINNKKYIGISSDVKRRWCCDGYNYYDQVFGSAIQKYGWDGFDHEILFDNLSKEQACKYEQQLIEQYKTLEKEYGYNRSKGGDAGSYGAYNVQINKMVHVFQYDLEGNFIKEYISIASAIRELIPGYTGRNSYNIPTCCKGKRLTALGYRWFYTYQGEKIEPILSPEERTINGRSKQIFQYTLDGKFITSYKSIAEAKKIYKSKTIDLCVAGKIKTSAGYQWFDKYYGEQIAPIESNIIRSQKSKFKQVHKYDLQGYYIESYESIEDAAKSIGLKSASHISSCCKGCEKTAGGFIWSYIKTDKLNLEKQIT